MPTSPGRYIVLEGDEGAGKTAQLTRIQHHLQGQGLAVQIVREPGGDPFAEQLRQILKHADYHIPPIAEVLAFSAARASMLESVVRPLLQSGTWVISDRSYVSTLVYQGLGHGLESPQFHQVVEYGIQAAPPDLVIILDISLAESQHRQQGRGLPPDRFDLGDEFRHTINTGYRNVPARDKLVHVDGHGSFDQVQQRIIAAINARQAAHWR